MIDPTFMRRLLLTAIALGVVAGVAIAIVTGSGTAAQAGYGVVTPGANLGVSKPVATCEVHRVPCPRGELRLISPFGGGSSAALAFGAFRRQVLAPSGRRGYLRLWIAYDALYGWDPISERCTWSPYAFGPRASFNGVDGTALFGQLVWDVQGARALGLTPEVVFSAGSGDGAPHYPDPGFGDGGHLFAGITTAGYDYYCGVLGIIRWMRSDLGANAPTEWEAFNEPDSKSSYTGYLEGGCVAGGSCGFEPLGVDYNYGGYLCGRRYGYCGALEAAELWELAETVIAKQRWPREQIAALTLTAPESAYLAPYIGQLNALASCAPLFVPAQSGSCTTSRMFPHYWAVHDYDDPTAGGTADLRSFELVLSRLAARRHGALQVWVTESGVELSSQTRADLNRGGCAPPGGGSATLGRCVDASPVDQARGARVWRGLIHVGAPGVRTTQVYWFEFQLIPGWDSALVDASGRPRRSFCALVSAARCDGNSTAGPSAA